MAASNSLNCILLRLVREDNKNYADIENGILYCKDSDGIDECVFMTSSMFLEIWGQRWKEMPQKEAMLPVVKLTYDGRSIYRRYRQIAATGFCNGYIGLTQRSISLLSPGNNIIKKDVEVSVGDIGSFFENHPDHGIRMAYEMGEYANKIGTASLVIGISSFVISVVSLLITFLH